MVEQPPRCLRYAVPDPGTRRDVDESRRSTIPAVDDPQSLVGRVDELDGADDDRLERVAALGAQPRIPRRLLSERAQLVVVECVTRQRPHDIRRLAVKVCVQRVGPGDVLLHDMGAEVGDVEGAACARDDRTALERITVGRSQSDVLLRLHHVGELEAGHQGDGRHGIVAGLLQRRTDTPELLRGRQAVEAADADVDGVDGASTDEGHEGVAGFLQPQSTFDDGAVVGGHLDRPGVAQEVRCVQQVDVQRVALDPLAAVQQPAQQPQLLRNRYAAGVLDRQARAHLVGDGADPADAGGDVRGFRPRPAAQERLEEPRWLEDAQLHVGDAAVLDDDVHAAFALDPGQGVHVQDVIALSELVRHGATSSRRSMSWRSLSRRNVSAPALKVRKTRITWGSSMPSTRSRSAREPVFAVSCGPKQP